MASSSLVRLKKLVDSHLVTSDITCRLDDVTSTLVLSVTDPCCVLKCLPMYHVLIDNHSKMSLVAYNGQEVEQLRYSWTRLKRLLQSDQHVLCCGIEQLGRKSGDLVRADVLKERVADQTVTRSQHCQYIVSKEQQPRCAACQTLSHVMKDEDDLDYDHLKHEPNDDQSGEPQDAFIRNPLSELEEEGESEVDEDTLLKDPVVEAKNEETTCESEPIGCIESDTHEKPKKRERESRVSGKLQDSLVCDLCGRAFPSSRGLLYHLVVSHEKKEQRQCFMCGFVCRNSSTFRRHLQRRHQPYRPFSCQMCGYRSKLRHMLRDHVTKKHKIESAQWELYMDEDKSFNLEKALEENKGLDFKDDRWKSSKSEVLEKDRQCDRCGKVYDTVAKFKAHIASVHDRPFKEKGRMPCYICGKYITRSNMRKHYKRHSTTNVYGCSLCAFETKTRTSVRQHVMEVHKKRQSWQQYLVKIGEHDFETAHQDKAHLKELSKTKLLPTVTTDLKAKTQAQECPPSTISSNGD